MKRIPCENQKEENDAFREANILRGMSAKCPYVVRLVDEPFRDGDLLCIVTPLYSDSLYAALNPKLPSRIPPAKRIAIAAQLVQALGHVHSEGVVHRDIKSLNVLVAAGQNKCVLADFGLSRSAVHDVEITATAGLGTVSYMSPEMASRAHYSSQTDIWSLGLVLMELVLGYPLDKHTLNIPETIKCSDEPAREVAKFLAEGDIDGTEGATSLKQTVVRMLHRNPLMRITTTDLVQQPFVLAAQGNLEACADLTAHMSASLQKSAKAVKAAVKKNKNLTPAQATAQHMTEERRKFVPRGANAKEQNQEVIALLVSLQKQVAKVHENQMGL